MNQISIVEIVEKERKTIAAVLFSLFVFMTFPALVYAVMLITIIDYTWEYMYRLIMKIKQFIQESIEKIKQLF